MELRSIVYGGARTPVRASPPHPQAQRPLLEKLYRWAEAGLLVRVQSVHPSRGWRRGYGNRRARFAARSKVYERAAKRSDVSLVSLEDYRVFVM